MSAQRAWSLRRRLILGLLACAAALVAIYGAYLNREAHFNSDLRARSFRHLEELSLAYLQATSRLFSRVEVLQEMAIIRSRAFEQRGSDFDVYSINEFLGRVEVGNNVVSQVAGTDANGILRWTTLGPIIGSVDISDREHFRAIVVDGRESWIGRPVLGRVSGRRTIQFSRAARLEGRFIGVVVVSVDADLAAQRYVPAPPYTLSLIRRDGLHLGSTGTLDRLPAISPALLALAEEHGGWSGALAFSDGTEHLVSLRPVSGAAAFVLVDRPTDGLLEKSDAHKLADLRTIFASIAFGAIALILQSVSLLHNRALRRAALREEERAKVGLSQLDEIASNLTDLVILGVVRDGLLTVVEYASSTAPHYLGISAAELRAQPDRLCPVAEDGPLCHAACNDLFNFGEFGPTEVRLQRPDGTTLWVEITGRRVAGPITDAESVRALLVFRDIERRVIAREKVAASDRLFAEIGRLNLGWLVEIEVDRSSSSLRLRTASHSGAVRPLTGYARDQVSDRRLGVLLQTRANMRLMMRQIRLAASGVSTVFEMTFEHRTDNRQVVIEFNLSRVAQVAGRSRIVGFAIDITEKAALRAELEHASKLAFLGEIAPSIAHELNQPLAAIALRAETLALRISPSSPDHAVVESYVENIVALTQRASDVIRNVRSFARRDAPDGAAVELRRSIDAALSVMEGRIRQSGVTVRLDMPSSPVFVRGQEMQVEQVIMNLVANACDAYRTCQPPVADPEVLVRVEHVDSGLKIEIIDHAGGIPEVIRERIFAPFFTTKAAGQGSGLGLSIVERMVKQMHGTINCENRDCGSVFVIHLPDATPVATEAVS